MSDEETMLESKKNDPHAGFFWRNQRISLARLGLIANKFQTRGVKWFWKRLKQEFTIPETTEGVYLRDGNAWLFGLIAFLLSPFLFLFNLVWGNKNTLYYFFDLEVSPITFDIADYLVLAEIERRNRGLENLYVYIVPGRHGGLREEGGEYEKVVDRSARYWRLNNLVIPVLSLLPTCLGYSICKDRWHATLLRMLAGGKVFPETYWPVFPVGLFRRQILEAARQGVQIFPIFRSPDQSLRYVEKWLKARIGAKRCVTVTLRHYQFESSRNSNVQAWADFAKNLNPEIYTPVFILDTEVSMDLVPDEIKDFLFFPEAPWNMALRSALYELAYLNMAIVHGPTALLWYNDRCRYVIFFPDKNSSQTQTSYVKDNGLIPGESLPFAAPFQKWVWKSDECSTIQEEFQKICHAIDLVEKQ